MRKKLAASPHRSGGLFHKCLVEGDAAELARSRRLRQGSLLASLAVQAGLLAALVLVPLFATGSRLVYVHLTPIPPYPRALHGNPESARGGTTRLVRGQPTHSSRPIYQPPSVPHDVARGDRTDSSEPGVPGVSPGPEVPGATGGSESTGDSRWMPKLPATLPAPKSPEKLRAIVSEGVQQALLVHRVEPVYPILAKQIHLQGAVQLHAIIARDGAVHSLEVLSGHPILAKVAMEAVSQWRYRPTLLNGEPVEVETYVTVIFQLQR